MEFEGRGRSSLIGKLLVRQRNLAHVEPQGILIRRGDVALGPSVACEPLRILSVDCILLAIVSILSDFSDHEPLVDIYVE